MSQDRLNSWKEIAAYLKCDESTSRRWERRNGLPIHRVGKGASVYAYAHEIEDWLKSQSILLAREQQSTELTAKIGSIPENLPAAHLAVAAGPIASAASMQSTEISSTERFSRWKLSFVATLSVILIGSVSAILYASKSLYHTPQVINTANPTQSEFSDTPISEAIVSQLKEHVKSAQIWETLTLYAVPWTCDARDVERYWERGSKAYNDVVESASRLNERGWHYGFGARLLNFEFRYVRLARDGASAEIGTREHWWLPMYTRDESPVTTRNPDQGPYEIDYLLVKINGQWYLRSENTPYPQWKPQHITCKNWHP